MLRYLFIALGLVLMFFLWRTYRSLLDLVGTSVEQLKTDLHPGGRGLLAPHQGAGRLQREPDRPARRHANHPQGDHRQGLPLHRRAVPSSADSIAQIAEQTAQFATYQQSTQTMAAAIEELVVSISHLSDNATHADELSKVSANTLEEGSGVIKETLDSIQNISTTVGDAASTISELNGHTQQISEIIG
ncbi:hypothetical protein ACF2JD_02760 [Aeromonas sp. A-5]|uniref:hypothetical protein n=1 Tax=Aeromonas ichthyocola TaxID=3367746 RepID=UPI0038E7B308